MRFLVALLLLFIVPFAALSQTKVKLSELKRYVGDSVMTEGKVKTITHEDSSSLTSPILITIGNGSNSLTLVIASAVRSKFSVKPEDAFENKSIRVSGKLLNLHEALQIMINDPSQIVLIDHK
jgi:hypothetical protein